MKDTGKWPGKRNVLIQIRSHGSEGRFVFVIEISEQKYPGKNFVGRCPTFILAREQAKTAPPESWMSLLI